MCQTLRHPKTCGCRQEPPSHRNLACRVPEPHIDYLMCGSRRVRPDAAFTIFLGFSHFPGEMNSVALSDYLDAAAEAARRGAAVLEKWRRATDGFRVQEKGHCDLVTSADLESQKTIRDYLAQRFPSHLFLGEEDEQPKVRPGRDSPPLWIVDPLDGTTNYVHDCPFYCVSIGLLVAGELVVGAIFEPCRQELYGAAKGSGAWLNGKPLRVSQTAGLERALLSTGFPPDLRGQERVLDWWRYLSLRTQSLRRTGSTALNLAYVAAGRFDAHWGFDNHPWDIAAGVVLVREAGGTVTNIDGTDHHPFRPDMLASNGVLHPTLLSRFREGP